MLFIYLYIYQDQYEFIHHALSELVVCGETEVSASCLRSFTGKLKAVDNAGITGLQKHFQVKIVGC